MKRFGKKSYTLALFAILALALAGAASAGHHSAKRDIVDTAVAADSFGTLVAAVQAAGLVEALKGDGPFTVFAPTDEAFAKLPEGTVENLLQPENLDRLTEILTYHVVSGRVSARQAAGLDRAETLNGQELGIDFRDGRLKVDDASVVANDIDCENGVIHVIDSVLIPEEARTAALEPRELIRLAISRGAPIFNHGQPAACAAIYEVAAEGLLGGFPDELSESSRGRLSTALRKSRTTRDAGDRAWVLRRALDDVYAALGGGSGAERMSAR